MESCPPPSPQRGQHPSGTHKACNGEGPKYAMPEDMGSKIMAEGVDTVTHHPITEEGKLMFMPKLSYHTPH